MVQLFLDCEFTGLVQNTTLISIALYRDEDCYFYAEFSDYNTGLVNNWIDENVITKLYFKHELEYSFSEKNIVRLKNATEVIVDKLNDWLTLFEDIEIWGDVPVYDWMLFCDLFGGALNLPKNIHYIPFDIATLGKIKLEKNDFSRIEYVKEHLSLGEQNAQHNALIDAKIEKLCFEKLSEL